MEKPAFGVRQFLLLLVIAFGCMTAGGLLGNLIMDAMSRLMRYDYAFVLDSVVMKTPARFTFLFVCICAPLGEELLFRKLLIDRVRRFGDLTAILLSGFLFGLFHGNLFQFFYAALVGMILAYVYTRSGRYSLCVIMHSVINFVGSVVSPAVTKLVRAEIPAEVPDDAIMNALLADPDFVTAMLAGLLLVIWEIGTLAAGISLLCARFRDRRLSRGALPLSGDTSSLPLCNPGMAACVAVMLLFLIVNLIPTG
jgi:membrane protease YdiL (CAAX protease family)